MAKQKPHTATKTHPPIITLLWLTLLTIILCTKAWLQTNFFQPLDFDWLLDRYFLSQDIPHEVAPDRVFLTDGQIHLASGWLYAVGNDPIQYNFQHPPLIKYLYGLSILGFSWPQLVQLSFGIGLIAMTFALGRFIFHSSWVGFIASLLLTLDPVFLEVTAGYLLDLGQAFFLLLYIYLLLVSKRHHLAGIILGFLIASKFWGSSLFLVAAIGLYLIHTRKITLTRYVQHFLLAALVYALTYVPTFIHARGAFNLIFFELKRIKYWLQHSTSSMAFASLILFLTGWYRTWWADTSWTKHTTWSPLWPFSLSTSTFFGAKALTKHKSFSLKVIIYLLPLSYLAFLGFQAPFSRYFILILPFAYMSLAHLIETLASPYLKLSQAKPRTKAN